MRQFGKRSRAGALPNNSIFPLCSKPVLRWWERADHSFTGSIMLKVFFSSLVLILALAAPSSAAFAAVDPAPFSSREVSQNKNVLQLLASAEKAMRANKMDDALHQLNLAASLEPNNPYIVARLAMALNRIGEFQSSLDRLRRARTLGASNDMVLGPMLDAMLSMGQNQVVLDLYPDPAAGNHSFAAGM